MGDNFLKQQVRNFKRRRDRAMTNLGRPTLFDNPEIVKINYPLNPLNGHTFQEGDKVYVCLSKDKTAIEVTDGHRRLADVSKGDAVASLQKELADPNSLPVIRMKVVQVGQLSKIAQAQIINERDKG